MSHLEDEFSDIISKAQRGRGLSTEAIAHAANVTHATVREARNGTATHDVIAALARVLDLNADGLQRVLEQRYAPPSVEVPGLHRLEMDAPMPSYPQMRVNAYLVHRPESSEAVLFDTGTSLPRLLAALESTGTALAAVFLTHTHWDHINALPGLRKRFPEVRIYSPMGEPVEGGRACPVHQPLALSGLTIEARSTPGHSDDALTYLVAGLDTPLAIVGDALFAGSMGGVAPARFPRALKAIEREIFSLPPATLLCPGHGMLTTAAYERRWNPFSPIRLASSDDE